MNKIIMIMLLFCVFSQNTFAQAKKQRGGQQTKGSQVFREFSSAHDWIMQKKGMFEITMSFLGKGSTGTLKAERAQIFLNPIAKAIYLIQKGKPTLILNHEMGSWVTDSEQVAPLKIAGTFVIYGLLNIDDVIGLDLRKTYKIEKNMGNSVLLKGRKKGATYPYMLLKKLGPNKFEAEFKDHTKRSVKEGIFTLGTVDGVRLIKKGVYRDLVMDTKRLSSYEIKSVRKSKVPDLVLDPNRFRALLDYVKKN